MVGGLECLGRLYLRCLLFLQPKHGAFNNRIQDAFRRLREPLQLGSLFPLFPFFLNLPNILTPPAYLLPTGCVAGGEGCRPTSKRNVSLQQATGQAGSTLGVRHRTPFEEGKGGAIDRTWGNAHGSGGLPNGAATSLRRRGLV